MLIPEVILYNTLRSFIELASKNYMDLPTGEKSKSILYNIFGVDQLGTVVEINNYNYFKQAVALLVRGIDSQRKCEVFIGYNQQKTASPSVHILMPSDSKGRIDAIGDDFQTAFNETTGETGISKTKSSTSTYHLMFTSDNSSEVLIMYYFFRSMVLLFSEHFELSGLRSLQFNGADINMQSDLIPAHIFHRSLGISMDYEYTLSMIIPSQDITGFNIQFCVDLQLDNDKFRETFDKTQKAP